MAVGQIISRAIATGAIGADQIATGAITAADIPTGEITADKLHQTLDLSSKTVTMPQASITAHQAALSITESQVSDLQSYVLPNTSPTFTNTTLTGYLAGPATFTIDPAGVGDNTGTVIIAGNLQVDGTTTTINSTTLTVDDLNITLADGAANAAAANGAGITVDGANATITYDATNDEWDFNKDVNVTGNVYSSGYVGVGTTTAYSASTDFEIKATDPKLVLNNTGTRAFGLVVNGTKLHVRDESDDEIHMTVTEQGNVGIGTDSPTEKLHVSGNIKIQGTNKLNLNTNGSLYWTNTGNIQGVLLTNGSIEDINIITNQAADIVFWTSGENRRMTITADGKVGIGVDNFSVFNGVGGNSMLVIKGSNTATNIANNSNASITIANDDGTANNTAGLHFARADTDDNPHYAGASIVTQFTQSQVTGQYPKADLVFLTSTDANFAPSEKMRISANGNVGIGTTTPTHKLEVAGTTKAQQYLLDAIAKDISDTAVDVFVYDTRKDSDGGAWRKRTQHTSWYNETLNTATRGSRKEFPAVAVIVAETNQVTIYDGDDPDMPMWMVFNQGGTWSSSANLIMPTTPDPVSVSFLNGILSVAYNNGYGVGILDFISESKTTIFANNVTSYNGNISQRNNGVGHSSATDARRIVNSAVNDVAMTVLPNAPIDSATGLPVPTIAVATDGGVSVIKDDGTVVDIADDGSIGGVVSVAFYGGNKIWTGCNTVGSGTRMSYSYVIPTSDTTASSTTFRIGKYVDPTTSGGDLFYSNVASNISKSMAYGDNNIAAHSDGTGLLQIAENEAAPSTGMTNFISSGYNTGWMTGDIKLATLSDTDDTNVADTNLVTNGTFDSNTTGWTSLGATLTQASGRAVITSVGGNQPIYQAITCEIGKRYVFKADLEGYFSMHLGTVTSSANDVGYIPHGNISAQTDLTLFFTATQTTHYVLIYVIGTGNVAYADNVSVTLAEDDRSVNGGYRGNGLQVFGTVTKNPVATGADLVSYSGFTTNNYLLQPYNADLQFGTGGFSSTWWFKSGADNGTYQWLFERQAGELEAFVFSGTGILRVYVGGNAIETGQSVFTGVWHQLCFVRRSGVGFLYLDGQLKSSTAMTGDMSTTNSAPLTVGARNDGTYPVTGHSLALLRISATAPSEEQIKKIYNDEKHLFQENAKATLYGTSDAVTALAYDDDTELLHVGTSAGRSVFQGLRRIDNTTDAVGAAISASNGMVAED